MNIKNRITAVKFAWIYNLAKSPTEAARRMGMSARTVNMRASLYRTKYGVELQKFGNKAPEVDWAKVRGVAVLATKKRLARQSNK